MNNITKMLGAFFLYSLLCLAQAETQKTILFENQREEIFELENWLKETQYRDEEVKDTCHKEVPYEEKVCKDITKYKQECQTIPAHQKCENVNRPICHNETKYETECLPQSHRECHNEMERVCHNETRYENQCSRTPDRQECRTINEPICRNETRYENECRNVPGEQVCRIVIRHKEECQQTRGERQCRQIPPDIRCRVINGENRCEKIPAHEECTEGSSQRVCRQVPYEERECQQGPSRQECRQVPRTEQVCENRSRQQCENIPGRQECRQVPRTEQICHNENRQVCRDVEDRPICRQIPRTEQVCVDHMERECDNIPAREVCRNIPYQEQVCSMEQRTKDVPYECMKTIKVPHVVVVKTHKAHVQMEFDAKAADLSSQFLVTLDNQGSVSLAAKENAQSNVVAFLQKDITHQEQAGVNSISALYKLSLFDRNEDFKFMNNGIQNIKLQKRSLEFLLEGKVDLQRGVLELVISKKGDVKFQRAIPGSALSASFDGTHTRVLVDLEKLGAEKLGGIVFKTHNVRMKLKLDYSDLGDILINNRSELAVEINQDVKLD